MAYVSKERQAELRVEHKEERMETKMQYKYDKEIAPMLFQITLEARNGSTDEQIAEFLGMTRSTLWRYKEKFPEIGIAIEQGRDSCNNAVENALYRLASGYDYYEYKDKYDAALKEWVFSERYRKHCSPKLEAIVFYLTNKKPHEWKKTIDIKALTQSVNANMSMAMKGVSEDKTRQIINDFDKSMFGGSSIPIESFINAYEVEKDSLEYDPEDNSIEDNDDSME